MVRDGIQVPDDLAVQPKLASNLVHYLDAFYDLDTERNHGQGLSRIPWSAITHYGDYYGLDHDELQYFIRGMDDALLEHMAKTRGGSNGGGSTGAVTVVQRPPRPD